MPLGSHLGYVPLLVGNFHIENNCHASPSMYTYIWSVVHMWLRVCTLCIFPPNYMEWYFSPHYISMMSTCINVNRVHAYKKIKTIVIPLLPYFLSPIMNRSCQTLFLQNLFMYFIAIARLSHGLDSVERESSVGAFLLRLRLLTSLLISHSQSLFGLMLSPPDFAALYSHLALDTSWELNP